MSTSSITRTDVSSHAHEADRLESLQSYGLLDSCPELVYDEVVLLAAKVCDAPMAAIALVDTDRVWFKARHGIPRRQVRRTGTFCTEVVARQRSMLVTDSRDHARFATAANDGVLAYAGVPLVGRDGLPIGTLCVFDTQARQFPAASLEWLQMLADQTVAHMELRRTDRRAGLPSAFGSGDVVRPDRIRVAIDNGELKSWFQPVIDLATGRRCGAESLLRWDHPEIGIIPPNAFLPLLEATGLILPVGRQVVRRSLSALRDLHDRGTVDPGFGVSINASATEIAQPGFAASLIEEVDRLDLPRELVTVELTETGGATPIDAIRCGLEQVREAGLNVDADDFGSGHSTLQRLLDLPLTGIKLDMGLISRVPHDVRASGVVRWLVLGAHDLGLRVVAEGVETQAQHDFLRDIGCDRAQGYFYGRPDPDLSS